MKKAVKALWLTVFTTVLMGLFFTCAQAVALPDTPTGLEVNHSYTDSVSLYWDYNSYADGYRVFVRQDGKWKKVADTDYSSYTVEDLTASTNYRFAVRSYVEYNDKLYWSKSYSSVNAVTDDMSDYFYASAEEYGTKVTLSWDKEAGASGYRIFRYASGKWSKVKDVSKKYDSYTVQNLEIGKTYYFAVRPYAKTDSRVVWGDLSNTCKIKTTDPTIVKITSCEEKEKSITLNWKQVPTATGYRIFMYTGGKWKALKTLAPKTSTTYTVTGLKSDTKYTFAVRAYKKSNGNITWYQYKSFKAYTIPAESDLRLYRIDAYDKKFTKNYMLEMSFSPIHYGDFCRCPSDQYCYYAKKNGYMADNDCFIFNGRGISRTIYNQNRKLLYAVYDDSKAYERSYDEYYESYPWPDSIYRSDYDVYIDEFNGQTVVCESFYAFGGDLYECYFKAGELVGYRYEVEYGFEGDYGGVYVVTNFTTTDIPNSYFSIPKDYKLW